MRTDIFDFDLPENRIANEPVFPPESAKLLHIVPQKGLCDSTIGDLPSFLTQDDILVFNDTKVIPARIYGKRGEAEIELTLLKQIDLSTWNCLVKNARRLKPEQTIVFSEELSATVISKTETVTVRFNKSGADLFTAFHKYGIMPLPPYIKREKGGKEEDKANYQTIYAKHEGAVAAPTAGLHFTEALMQKFDEIGVQKHFITLHVGGGTFLPVKVEDTKDHKMHSEFGVITKETSDALNQAKKDGKRIIAVGTTALRLLESASDENGILHPFESETDIFITPGYRFRFVDRLFTNFHLSHSTLFMLVCAFAGIDEMKNAYAHAIKNDYRFFSYGDACLIEKAK